MFYFSLVKSCGLVSDGVSVFEHETETISKGCKLIYIKTKALFFSQNYWFALSTCLFSSCTEMQLAFIYLGER